MCLKQKFKAKGLQANFWVMTPNVLAINWTYFLSDIMKKIIYNPHFHLTQCVLTYQGHLFFPCRSQTVKTMVIATRAPRFDSHHFCVFKPGSERGGKLTVEPHSHSLTTPVMLSASKHILDYPSFLLRPKTANWI